MNFHHNTKKENAYGKGLITLHATSRTSWEEGLNFY